MDDDSIALQDRSWAEIEAVLAQGDDNISFEQWLALTDFIVAIGGLDNALLAIKTLRRLEGVA